MNCYLKPLLFTCMFACRALSNTDGDEGNGKTTHTLLTVFHWKKKNKKLFFTVSHVCDFFSRHNALSSPPGLKLLAFLLFLVLPLRSSSPPLLCFPLTTVPAVCLALLPVPCHENHKHQNSAVPLNYSLMLPHVGRIQLLTETKWSAFIFPPLVSVLTSYRRTFISEPTCVFALEAPAWQGLWLCV